MFDHRIYLVAHQIQLWC